MKNHIYVSTTKINLKPSVVGWTRPSEWLCVVSMVWGAGEGG
jgi:hypothetical protein